MAASRINGPLAKVERAEHHIEELKTAIREFSASEPYTFVPKDKAHIDHVGLCIGSIQPVPLSIVCIIGDAVHNLRSSLDHLAWQLVEAGGGKPSIHTCFPVCKDVQKYESALLKGAIQGMHSDAEKMIKECQRYISGDDTLWHIHELDRFDKHRLLIAVAVGMGAWGVEIGGRPLYWQHEDFAPLEVGYEVLNIPVDKYGKVKSAVKLAIDIAFGQTEVVAGKRVLELLEHMTQVTKGVITKFSSVLI